MTISEAIDKLNHAKKWSLDADFIKALEMAIKALEEKQTSEIVPSGTKVRVTKSKYGHKFRIGEVVGIEDYYVDKVPYECSNDITFWWLSREEFEPV